MCTLSVTRASVQHCYNIKRVLMYLPDHIKRVFYVQFFSVFAASLHFANVDWILSSKA